MLSDIWQKTLWDQRRTIIGWGIGFAVVALVYGSFFPLAATPEYVELIDSLPEGLVNAFGWGDIASPEGYLGSTVYGLLGSALVSVMAVGLGARAIAGSEEDGHLELLIALPVSRQKVVVHKSVALIITCFVAASVVFLAVMIIREPIDLDISVGNLAATSLNLALLGSGIGLVAMAAGSATGKRGVAVAVGAAFAVAAFLIDGLAPQLDSIAWMERLSPFHWYDATTTLREGLNWGRTGALAGLTVVLLFASVILFGRRDVKGT